MLDGRVILSCLAAAHLALTCHAQELHELRGEIVDADSGSTVAARLYLQDEAGRWHHAQSTSGRAVTYEKRRGADSVEVHTSLPPGPFAAQLPAGRCQVTVERGPEYRTTSQQVEVGPASNGQPLRLTLRRWINMADRGWYSGETHVHRTMKDLPVAMLAEDLNVALPLNYWVTDSRAQPSTNNRNPAAVPPARLIEVDPQHVIWPVNTEYEIFTVDGQRHTLGAMFLLNHSRPLQHSAPPVGPALKQVESQRVLVDLDKHNWPWSMMLPAAGRVDLYELANNHMWRTRFSFSTWYPEYVADFMQVEMNNGGFTERGWIQFTLANYYTLLNCGFRLRPTAGTASGVHPVPLGFGRVYVHLPDGFSYDGWIDGLDAGRSFVTTGPMLEINGPGGPLGGRIESQSGDRVTISGRALSQRPLDRVELVVNGRVAQSFPAADEPDDNGRYVTKVQAEVPLQQSAWLAVRCFAKLPDGRLRMAHTAPLHCDVPGRPLRPRLEERQYLIRRVEDEIQRHRGVLSAEALAEFGKALETYRKLEVAR